MTGSAQSRRFGGIAFCPALLGIFLLATISYLAGNSRIALWDRDEGWYAEISRAMLMSDRPEWVVPMFAGKPFSGKPPLAFWCQAISMRFFGATPFAARLPSAIAISACVLILGITIARAVGKRRAIWTVLVFSTSLVVIIAAKTCLVDALLLLWVVIAQICLYALYTGNGRWWIALLFWVCVGLGVLTKLPVIAGMLGATVMALWILDIANRASWNSPRAWLGAARWWLSVQPIMGIIVVAAICGPWFWLMYQRAPEYLNKTLGHHVAGPIFSSALEGHGGPPGYYLLLIWPMFLPWSWLLGLVAVKSWQNRRLAPIRFALAAVVGPWIVLECVRQKLPLYFLPVIPALAFLLGDTIVRCVRGQYRQLHRPAVILGSGASALAIIAISLSPWIFALPRWRFSGLPYLAMTAVSVLGILYGLGTLELFRRIRPRAALVTTALGMTLIAICISGALLPALPFLQVPRVIAQKIDSSSGGGIAFTGYDPPSLIFYTRGMAREIDSLDALSNTPAQSRPDWIIATADQWNKNPTEHEWFEKVSEFRALDYGGRARIVDVYLARNRSSAAQQR